jgi:hypothetical protein
MGKDYIRQSAQDQLKIIKRRRMLYGRRTSANIIFDTKMIDKEAGNVSNDLDLFTTQSADSDLNEQQMSLISESSLNCFDILVISHDNPYKSKFDVFLLILVVYSCISALYNSAFLPSRNIYFVVLDWAVEGFFYTDLILSFFQGYIDP